MKLDQAMFQAKDDRTWGKVLFVDPGIIGSGCAFWDEVVRAGITKPASEPQITEGHNPKDSKLSWDIRADVLCAWFNGVIHTLEPQIVVIEFPELWSSSPVSQASAGRGDLFKLAYLVGAFGEIVRHQTGTGPVLISPAKWKGQLTKKAVHARIERALGDVKYPEHIADAVGMGLAVQGKL